MDQHTTQSDFAPLVSIVIPVYNGANYMREAIDSALAQSYPHIEVIVVNDGSRDQGQTHEIALSYGDRIRYFHKENGHVASALNYAIERMKGDYFSWLSHDDVYYPHKVQTQIDFLRKSSNKKLVLYSDIDYINNSSEVIQRHHFPHVEPGNFRLSFVHGGLINGCTLLVPREAFAQCGLFDTGLRTTQDYDCWFRISERYDFVHQAEVLVQSRDHPMQDSKAISELFIRESSELFTNFLNKISIEEIKKNGRSPSVFYIEFAKTMKRQGFSAAEQRAMRLAMRHVFSSANVKRNIGTVLRYLLSR